MNSFLKELPWIILGVILGLAVSYPLGMHVLIGDTTLDINIHDTYFVFNGFEGILFCILFFVFLIYVLRSIRCCFKNRGILLTLIFSGVGMIILLSSVLSLIGVVQNLYQGMPLWSDGWTLYPPITGISEPPDSSWNYLYYTILTLQGALVLFLIYAAYRAGNNKQLSE